MNISAKLLEVKNGFQPSFWVANVMELFERIAYYGQATGATGMETFSGIFSELDLYWVLVPILIFTAIGGSFIKPSVLGTVALTSTKESKSFGYAIYYWLVNIGAGIGPVIAFFVRDSIGIEWVYLVSAVSCALMFFSTLIFYKEPTSEATRKSTKISTVIKNLLTVVKNFKFMLFLLIFGFYWVIFWQIYIIVPFYITDYISPNAPFEIIQSVGAWGIILLQLFLNRLTKNMAPITAMITGFSISSLCWGIILFNPTIPFIIAGIVVLSIGEQIQAPRFYEYIADLAPEGQAALFQGYAFLPVAIGWIFGGTFGGWLYNTFATVANSPYVIFIILWLIGILTAALMAIYNFVIKRSSQ